MVFLYELLDESGLEERERIYPGVLSSDAQERVVVGTNRLVERLSKREE
jgi:ABC-type histidine transport system ATPase subunit